MFRILGVVSALALAAAFSHPCAIAATRPAAEDRGGPGGQGVPRRQDSATTVDTGGQDDAGDRSAGGQICYLCVSCDTAG